MNPLTTDPTARELAHRSADGIEVTLYWHGDDTLSVSVADVRMELAFELLVEPERALEAFYHPFAYYAPHACEVTLAG